MNKVIVLATFHMERWNGFFAGELLMMLQLECENLNAHDFSPSHESCSNSIEILQINTETFKLFIIPGHTGL
jgi:hypothetical protein